MRKSNWLQDYNGGRTLDDFVKFLEPEGAGEDSEEAEERTEEVWDYIDNKCNNDNKFQPGIHQSIQYSFTLAAA